MADTIRTDDEETVDLVDETEPATNHDVTEGGALGAIGGAIVGGLAGGPLGAVIGAIVGGVASAGAVSMVDKHDHDYDDTVSEDDMRPESDTAVVPSFMAVPGMASMGMNQPLLLVPPPDLDEPMRPMPSMPAEEPMQPMPVVEATEPTSSMPSADATESMPSMPSASTSPAWDLTSETRERAYALYEQRGHGDGHDVDDWLTAEREVFKG